MLSHNLFFSFSFSFSQMFFQIALLVYFARAAVLDQSTMNTLAARIAKGSFPNCKMPTLSTDKNYTLENCGGNFTFMVDNEGSVTSLFDRSRIYS